MSVLFGHPTGTPFAHHAALAHFEAGRLEAFCVPWMPSAAVLRLLGSASALVPMAGRLGRRHFPALAAAPKIQGRPGEWRRLLLRAFEWGDEGLAYEANDWLMRVMGRECKRRRVTAVHAYEDCSLWQFQVAKRLGKACIYDLPIGYYPAWERTQEELVRKYNDWLPAGGLPSSRYVRPEQKRQEIEVADVTLVPSRFVERTVLNFHPDKVLALAPFGVELDFWNVKEESYADKSLRFIYTGQLSLRKGTPLLLQAWERANLRDAELILVGTWLLADQKRKMLPKNVVWHGPCSSDLLLEHYRAADIFVFPSFFEGFGMVLLEAMACGLPAIATEATAGPDVMTEACGLVIPTGNIEYLIESLRWFSDNRDQVPTMSRAARSRAERFTWENYRRAVSQAVAPLV